MVRLAAALVWVGLASEATLTTARAQDAAAPTTAPAKAKAKSKVAKPSADGAQAADLAAKDPAVALSAYTSGVKSYQGAKFEPAVLSLNAAVQNGGLPANLMAKALYYRGAAYQQLGKPGQAISDLTSALWFKSGLDDAERAQATQFRANAYKDAGLSDQGQASPGQQTVDASAISTNAGKPAAAPGLGLNADATSAAEPSAGLGGIGKLFGNLFGGGSSTASAAAPSPPLAAIAAAEPASPSGAPEVLPWAKGSSPIETSSTKTAPPASAQSATKAAAKPAKAGTIRIQVAAVKTRDEASSVISKLQSLGGDLSALPVKVDETKFGAMGTFFRVRLGPFADVAATKTPCDALKAGGLDCLVTAK